MKEKLENACLVVKELGVDIDPEEIVEIGEGIGVKDYGKIAKTLVYIRKRFIEKESRVNAFKKAFPERCIVSDETEVEKWGGSKKKGEDLSETAITIKAKRLEESRLYRYIVTMLHTSMHIAYAFQRYEVIEHSLKKIFDPSVKDRDKVEYMKLFLQETKKPEKAIAEFNVNINQNNVSVVQIENRLDKIASLLEGKEAGDIIDVIGVQNGMDTRSNQT